TENEEHRTSIHISRDPYAALHELNEGVSLHGRAYHRALVVAGDNKGKSASVPRSRKNNNSLASTDSSVSSTTIQRGNNNSNQQHQVHMVAIMGPFFDENE